MNAPLPPPGQPCVYALVCDDGSIYIGWTLDLSRRFRQHQAGTAARWTKKHRPVRILHFELVATRREAMQVERQWKTGKGRYWLKKMANERGTPSPHPSPLQGEGDRDSNPLPGGERAG